MLIKRRKGWEIPETAATPEAIFLDRRYVMQGLGTAVLAGVAVSTGLVGPAAAQSDPSAGRYPMTRNMRFRLDRDLTDEKFATSYNNFYEFGSHKHVADAAQKLTIRPWEIKIDGMVKKPFTIGIDELMAKVQSEERLYRHRCVEAWAMAVPWSGFSFPELLKLAEPLGSAKYVRMETFQRPEQASGQRQTWYPWPYTEGLTIEEAANDLAFLATGVYGKPMPKQMGAPLRLAVPWKYGFKSIKSITRFTFTDQKPKSFWEALQPSEYGFWANVNPAVAHPRWSQASEELLGTGKRVPTQIFNGYGEYVADLYKNLEKERLWA